MKSHPFFTLMKNQLGIPDSREQIEEFLEDNDKAISALPKDVRALLSERLSWAVYILEQKENKNRVKELRHNKRTTSLLIKDF